MRRDNDTENPTAYHPLMDIFRFLLVSLNIDTILQESTLHRRREKLRKMTHGLGLGDAYNATIERIKAQDGDKSRLGMEALMWVSHAERPLRSDELCHALAVELGSRNFNTGNAPSISTLVSCCQGLITVDKEASTVRLIHFTLQEYLSSHSNIFIRPHSAIAEICLAFLNTEQVRAIPTNRSPHLSITPFLEYCSLYWGIHTKRELSDCAKSLALELFRRYDGHISIQLLLGQPKALRLPNYRTNLRFSGLHCASFFGIVEMAAALIEMECYDINEGDFWRTTPLAWAAQNGHEGVVKILLGEGEVNPDKPDDRGLTPLLYAARNGHKGVMEILLERQDVLPDKPDYDGRTPLMYASQNGHEEMVKILLAREKVNPDKGDGNGWTPLLYAASRGHEGVVKLLLEQDEVNPDLRAIWGKTPLSQAAWNGHEGVVKLLLEREEVHPDLGEIRGQTPLSQAASNGHEGVVKILLEREEVNPDEPANNGRTPLSYAAWNGHEGVVKLLLGSGEVNPDKPANNGKTPLSHAAKDGHEGVVKILLARVDVNPNKPDNDGQTPLMHATMNSHYSVMELLEAHKAVAPISWNSSPFYPPWTMEPVRIHHPWEAEGILWD